MIARVGYFEDFDLSDRDYVLDTLGGVQGYRQGFHLHDQDSGQSLSITLWDDEASVVAGGEAIAEATRSGNHAGPGPTKVQTFAVIRQTSGRTDVDAH